MIYRGKFGLFFKSQNLIIECVAVRHMIETENLASIKIVPQSLKIGAQ